MRELFLVTAPAVLVALVALELVFTYVVPASEYPKAYWDFKHEILRFDTEQSREGVRTIGPTASRRTTWRINNQGWNSTIDFEQRRRHRPLIAIIGDSYVAGLEVDVNKTFVALLRKRLAADFEVFGFGCPGRPLSTYLSMSRYVVDSFAPSMIVFVVVHNDFSESICRNSPPGSLCLDLSKNRVRERLIPYHSDTFRRVLRRSAVVRYLFLNLDISHRLHALLYGSSPEDGVSSPLAGRGDGTTYPNQETKRATDYVVKRIAFENKEKTILVVMDAPRTAIYEGTLEDSRVMALNKVLEDACQAHSVNFLDLTQDFSQSYQNDGRRFEFRYDGHWNEYGHHVVADALHEKLKELVRNKGFQH